MGVASAEEALQLTELEQLWLIPSHKNLIGANIELVGSSGASIVCATRWRACSSAFSSSCWTVRRRSICLH